MACPKVSVATICKLAVLPSTVVWAPGAVMPICHTFQVKLWPRVEVPSVTVTVTDGTSTLGQSFTWKVWQIGITAPGAQTTVEGNTASLQIVATDTLGQAMTYTAVGLPSGLSISATTGLISGTIAAGAGSSTPYTVTLVVSDGTVTASLAFAWTV